MKIGLNIFWQHYKLLDNKELFSKNLKNWLLGILYRYIHTYVLKLLLFDFVHFVSIHTLSVSIQKWSFRDRTSPVYRSMLACIDTHLYVLKIQRDDDVSNHACMLWYISVKSFKILIFVSIHTRVCIDTKVKNFIFNVGQSICIDTNAHLYRYMFENLCPNLLILFSL